jgi:hypothetical protein
MNLQVIKNRIKKILAYTVTSILFLIIAGFLILQMPPVQSRLIHFYLKDFSNVTGFTSTIESFKMLWFDRLELTGVSVYDPEGNKMIRAKEIMINFKLGQLLQQNDVNIDGIYLDSAHVYLTKIMRSDTSRDLNINVLIARINENFASSGGKSGKSPKLNIGEAFLNNSQFSYVDQYRDSIKYGFNYNQFSVAINEAQLKSFVILGDTTEFNVRTLIANDIATGFNIKQLSTFFRLSQGGMEFIGLDMRAGESMVKDTILLRYDRHLDLNDFIHKVRIHANISNSIINHKDLSLFAPGVERLGKPIHFSGIVNGKVDKFKINQMDVILGNTRLQGSLDMDGLPEAAETFIILNVKNSQLDPDDLAFLLTNEILDRLKPMGKLHVDGQFLGYPTDFVANGTLIGKLGTIKSDINFKVNEKDFNKSEYSGKLVLSDFSFGRYLDDTELFQNVDLDGQIVGSGLTEKTADFKLNGRVNYVGINGYNYRNINTNARFASGLFNGFLEINDPNLELQAQGSVDLREGINRIQLQAKLDTAYLHNLKLTKDEIFVHSMFKADVRGLSLDSLEGIAALQEVRVRYKGKLLSLDEVSLEASRYEGDRVFKVESTLVDAEIKGNYSFTNLSTDIQVLAKEIALNFRNNQKEINQYYTEKKHRPENYEAQIYVLLKDINPIADLLDINVKLSPKTKIEGRFSSGYTTIFNAYATIDTAEVNGTLFVNTEAELTASKIADSTAVLAVATVNSGHQQLNKNLKTKNLLAEGIWSRNHIDFGLDADQEGQTNFVRLSGGVDFLIDSTVISMNPSKVKLLERDWTFGENNFISMREKDLLFNNLALIGGQQSVALNGMLSDDPTKILTLKVHDLDLSIFNVLTLEKLSGVMNAQIDVSNYYKRPIVQNAISIKDLTVSDFLIGDLSGNNTWDTTARKFNIDVNVSRDERRLLNLSGDYKPNQKEDPLNVAATLDKADLKILEPFLKGIFSHIGGTVSGDFKITGKLESPAINGEGLVSDGQIMVDYLRTAYKFKGIVGLSTNSIYFKNIEMTDGFKNNGMLNGSIRHRNFNSMTIDLSAEFRNLQVLNTTIKDNSLFYGQAYATGNVEFTGPVNNLSIKSTARTERNTRIYVPISGNSSIEKKDFISFVNFRDTTFTKRIQENIQKNKVNLTGVTFDLNLDVTPDAYCEIIFDLKAGDIIRGRGNGELKLQLDTKGEFNMFGPFAFTEGWYNFTLYDIINKEFEIQRGSKITWYGDPYQAILDINASYTQNASLAPILTSTVQNTPASSSPQLRRKYPVQVLLKIEGLMLAFQVSFDIQAKDLPSTPVEGLAEGNLDIAFAAFKNKLDEQELYRQVFSLIVLRKFSPPDAFNASGSVVNSVSELLSNQLSYWMSQVDQNLEIDVDLNIMDEEAFNTFQLRLSYNFGRIRITGDGTFNNYNNDTPGATQATPSTFAGDWTVDYMLTADGKLRVKMYSRTNVNPILSSVNNQNTMTTGASLIHTQSFDEIRDLWKSRRSRSKKEAIKEEEQNDERKEEPKADASKDAIKEEDAD